MCQHTPSTVPWPPCLPTMPGFGCTADTGASFLTMKELAPGIVQIRKLFFSLWGTVFKTRSSKKPLVSSLSEQVPTCLHNQKVEPSVSTLFLPTWVETKVLLAPSNRRGLTGLSAFLEGSAAEQSIPVTIPAFKAGPLALMAAKICLKSCNGSQNRGQPKITVSHLMIFKCASCSLCTW